MSPESASRSLAAQKTGWNYLIFTPSHPNSSLCSGIWVSFLQPDHAGPGLDSTLHNIHIAHFLPALTFSSQFLVPIKTGSGLSSFKFRNEIASCDPHWPGRRVRCAKLPAPGWTNFANSQPLCAAAAARPWRVKYCKLGPAWARHKLCNDFALQFCVTALHRQLRATTMTCKF